MNVPIPAAEYKKPNEAYKEAGVDTDKAEDGLQRLIRWVTGTWPAPQAPGEVMLKIGVRGRSGISASHTPAS